MTTSSRPKQIEQFCCKRKVKNGRSFPSKISSEERLLMTKLDLTEAYWSIPVLVRSQPYLRFRWKNRVFQFLVLPFGLSSAPHIFTKTMKPITAALHEQGSLLIIFLDDILLIEENFSIVKENIQITIDLLTSLGLLVNLAKSILKPVQLIEFLGMIINSKTTEISLPTSKLDKITKQCNKLLKMQTTSIRDISTLLGLLETARPAVHIAPLHYR